MKKAAQYFGLVLLILIMSAATFTYVSPHFGWRVDTVASRSMEPLLKVGSLVVTRPVSPETIRVGDIITFESRTGRGTLITHRVIGIEEGSLFYFITRGDASGQTDQISVPPRNTVGKICFRLPYAGYVTEFLKTPLGFLIGLVIPALVIIVIYARVVWASIKQGKTNKVADE